MSNLERIPWNPRFLRVGGSVGFFFSRLSDFVFVFREARAILLRNGQAYGEITGEIQEQ